MPKAAGWKDCIPMNRRYPMAIICLTVLAVMTGPVCAQDVSGKPDDLKIGGNRITIGAGAALVPDYIGSGRSTLVPTVAIEGQISGISFNSQGTALYVDAIPGDGKPGWKLQLGPLAALRLDRSNRVDEETVAALGKRKQALELGGSVGIQRTGVVTSPYDTISFSTSWQQDVNGAHGSYVISPGLDYDTPLSTTAFASLSASADYVGRNFGHYYYDIDAAGSEASGLPAYEVAATAGWKDWNVSVMMAKALTGNLTHGFGVFATAGYARILGPYRRSPIVAEAGDANQLSGAVGLEFTF
jgi:outer membrane scaffolding protein for murein synthesis (MipA/OmpV family)